ncbi:MAG: hypothetical protein ABS36_11725 [Acidobacteria bacterium SCN 69-37]|nr:MAG: hypothetical protein ABS36_11725 [Acidobacteria bacterium SCN 69-37]
MLPASYATGTAVLLAVGGLLACFAGYRLFRLVLGLYGFLFGAFMATSIMGSANLWALGVAAVAGGVVGALLMVAAYFMGVGLVGAGLSALAMNLIWRAVGGDPPTWLLVIVCVIGALAALSVVRWVVIFGTAIAGAWTIIVAALALMGDPAAVRAASAGDVWILYPLGQTGGQMWQVAAWFGLTVVGVIVQTVTSRGGRRR